jgi:hypothetical protein
VPLALCLFQIILNPEFHSGLIPIVPSAQNESPVPITISEQSDYTILPKAIPVKALNTAKQNSGFCKIDTGIRVPKAGPVVKNIARSSLLIVGYFTKRKPDTNYDCSNFRAFGLCDIAKGNSCKSPEYSEAKFRVLSDGFRNKSAKGTISSKE